MVHCIAEDDLSALTWTKSLPNVSKLYLEKTHFDIGNSVKESKKGVQVISYFLHKSVLNLPFVF